MPSVTTKTCTRCKEPKPLSEFHTRKGTRDGLHIYCIPCERAYLGEWRAKNQRQPTAPTVTEKVCLRCGETKPAEQFPKRPKLRDGLAVRCIPCEHDYIRERRLGRRTKKADLPLPESKTCPRCEQTKPSSEFRTTLDGLYSYCIPCERAQHREWSARKYGRPDDAPLVTEKSCARCGETKPASEFNIARRTKTGLNAYCRDCVRARHVERTERLKQESPETLKQKRRDIQLKWYYGITRDEYNAMLSQQNGVCAICQLPESRTVRGEVKSLAVDHSHTDPNGRIRGLLCDSCNTGIGHFKDSIPLLQAAIEYLRKHGAEG